MHRSHIDAVEGSSLLSQLVYNGLGLPYVAGPAHLGKRQETNVPSAQVIAKASAGGSTEHSTVSAQGLRPDFLTVALTLMFLPPSITEFICSNASWAASGTSYSTKAKP